MLLHVWSISTEVGRTYLNRCAKFAEVCYGGCQAAAIGVGDKSEALTRGTKPHTLLPHDPDERSCLVGSLAEPQHATGEVTDTA